MEEWKQMIRQEITLWRDFHRYWIETKDVYFLRFEDLTSDPVTTLTGIFKYLLGVSTLEGSEIEQRIRQLASDANKPQLYKPRAG